MKKDEYGCLYRLRKRILSLTKAIVKYNDRNDMITYLSDILKWLQYGLGPIIYRGGPIMSANFFTSGSKYEC